MIQVTMVGILSQFPYETPMWECFISPCVRDWKGEVDNSIPLSVQSGSYSLIIMLVGIHAWSQCCMHELAYGRSNNWNFFIFKFKIIFLHIFKFLRCIDIIGMCFSLKRLILTIQTERFLWHQSESE